MQAISRRTLLRAGGAAAAASLACAGRLGRAQGNWPTTTKIIVPFVAGGGVDVNIRKIGETLSRVLGTQIVVDNKPGAGGLIAVQYVAMQPADGSTILSLSAGMLTLQALGGKLDMFKDLACVIKTTSSPHLLVVNGRSPYRTQSDLIAAARAQPGKLNYGTGGVGSTTHMIYETFAARVPGGMRCTHVPYKSVAAAAVPLVAGEIDFAFMLPAAVAGFLKSGEMRALSTTGRKRLGSLPDVPTVAELGMPGYVNAPWGGFALPGGAAIPLQERLFQATRTTFTHPDVVAYLASVGGDIDLSSSTAEMVAEMQKDLVAERELLKRLNITSVG